MKREIRCTVRFSEKEWNMLNEKVKESDRGKFKYGKTNRGNVSAYIRDILFREEVEEQFYVREIKYLTYQIRKIGININQATAKLNSGHQSRDTVFYLQKNLQQVEEEVKKMIEKLEVARHGDYEVDEYQTRE